MPLAHAQKRLLVVLLALAGIVIAIAGVYFFDYKSRRRALDQFHLTDEDGRLYVRVFDVANEAAARGIDELNRESEQARKDPSHPHAGSPWVTEGRVFALEDYEATLTTEQPRRGSSCVVVYRDTKPHTYLGGPSEFMVIVDTATWETTFTWGK